ncbi:hypothetical protein ACFL3V_06955 [Nanoarchaeota archaeon]
MIKRLHGIMEKEEKEDYARLLALEVNAYLKKIYKAMHKKVQLAQQKITPSDIVMKHASLGATKMWEFRLNAKDAVAKGDVGRIVVVTRGLDDEAVRKQRALFIAAEYHVYYAFANNKDISYFDSIRCQNQFWDMLKRFFRARNAHELRDQAIRYVVEEIDEHKLAHYRGKGWFVSIAKLKKHYPDIAKIVGSSEKTFDEIFKKQEQGFTPDMMKQEEDLVRKEMEDIDHLDEMLTSHEKGKGTAHTRKLVDIHRANLKTFRKVLADIVSNLDKWVLVDKEEHRMLRKKVDMPMREMHALLKEEAEAEEIDINKVHLVFNYFKKEKINILRDLEMFDIVSAKGRRKHNK